MKLGACQQNLKDSKKCQSEIQRQEMNMKSNDKGDDNNFPPETLSSQIEERLVRDDITTELYMQLFSTIFLRRKKEMLYVPLDFGNGLTTDALVDSGANVSAIARKEVDRIKQQSPAISSKLTTLPILKFKSLIGS